MHGLFFWRSSLGRPGDYSLDVNRDVAKILHWGTEAERRRLENRGAEGTEGVGNGEGVSPSPTDCGSEGVSWVRQAGFGAEPRPPTHFWHIWDPQNTSGRENRRPYVPTKPVFSIKNPLNRQFGAWMLPDPLPFWICSWMLEARLVKHFVSSRCSLIFGCDQGCRNRFF